MGTKNAVCKPAPVVADGALDGHVKQQRIEIVAFVEAFSDEQRNWAVVAGWGWGWGWG